MKQAENRIDHHRARIIGTIAAIHFLLSVAMLFVNGAITNSRFDGGGPPDLTAFLVNGVLEMLWFPLAMGFMLLKIANTGIWGWLPVLANSVVWGWVVWRAIRYWRSRHCGPLESI